MNGARPLVSVIVLNWNGMARLRQTLPSVLAINYEPLEIIIVDNGSTDNSDAFAEQLAAQSRRNARVVRAPGNIGYSRGKNLGATEARGKYLWLLDNDIEVPGDCLARLVEFMERSPAHWAAMPLLLDGGGDDRRTNGGGKFTAYGVSHLPNPNLRGKKIEVLPEIMDISYAAGGVLLTRRDWWERSGGFDPISRLYLDDYDLGVRTWIAGGRVALLTTVTALHHEDRPEDYYSRADWKWIEEIRGGWMFALKNFQSSTLATMLPLLFARQMVQVMKKTFLGRDVGFFFRIWMRAVRSLMDTQTREHIKSQRVRVQQLRQRNDSEFLGKV